MKREVRTVFGSARGKCKNCGITCEKQTPALRPGKASKFCSKECAKEYKAFKRNK